MIQILKLAFKNTLWFLAPSGIIFLVIIALNVYWGFSGVGARGVLSNGYYFLLFHNIPFFIASLILFAFLRRNASRIISILISNGILIGSWFLILYLSQFVIHASDFGLGGLLIFAIGIFALITFFIRSIAARYEFAANAADNAETARPSNGANKYD